MKWLWLIILLFPTSIVSAPSSKGIDFIPINSVIEVVEIRHNLSKDLEKKIKEVSKALQIKPEWLVSVIQEESRFNSKKENHIGAVGFIQFLPITLKQLKISKDSLLSLSDTAQLNIIEKFYKPVAGKVFNAEDLHLYTFFPIAVTQKWGDERILETSRVSAQTVVKCNRPIDLNKDMKITVGEYKTYLKLIK
jgi:hypothetical protein